jgi:hypothetical protein
MTGKINKNAQKSPVRNKGHYPLSSFGFLNNHCFFTGQVLIPNMAYSGQKPMALVNTNIPASTSSTMPKVPPITLVKYRMATSAATKSLTITSAVPIFLFMLIVLFITPLNNQYQGSYQCDTGNTYQYEFINGFGLPYGSTK